MNRRAVLVAAGFSLATSVAGCLEGDETAGANGDGTTDERPSGDDRAKTTDDPSAADDPYEECHLTEISYDWLPTDVQQEVDAALEDGRYETERLRLAEAVDTDAAYVTVDGTPYRPIVEGNGAATTLELREVDAVQLPEPREIRIENGADRKYEVSVVLHDGADPSDDEPLVDETVTVSPGEERTLEATATFGTYELVGRALTGHEQSSTFEFRVSDSYFDGVVSVSEDDIVVTQGVADMLPCPWA